MTEVCYYCNRNYDGITDQNHMIKFHFSNFIFLQENCFQNPNNLQSGQHQGLLYPNLGQTPQSNNSVDDARIPCEWCGQGVPSDLFQSHAVS